MGLEFFEQYGPGTYLFFEFARRLSILFCVMTVLTIPALVSNYLGGGLVGTTAGTTKMYFMQFSISNQAPSGSPQEVERNYYLVAIPDVAYSLIMFVFLLHWASFSKKAVARISEASQLPSYFTVEVSNHLETHTSERIESFMGTFGPVY